MRAAITTRYGPPEVLTVREVPTPTPADNEVLVRVRASSVCFGDRILRGSPPLIRLLTGVWPRHLILGVDLAGTVETVGPGVTRFAPGDAVYGARGDKFAAHAEFACVAEDGFIARKPATMTFEEAGTVFVGAACSLYFLRKANVKPGERVLVHGASGSLGVFTVQLAKNFGAHVNPVCSSANLHLVRSLGADDVIDYTAQDFTDGGPVHDVIVDVLGKAGFPRSLRALKPGGRYLLVGFSGGLGGIARALVTGGVVHLCGRARFLTGAADPKQADLRHVASVQVQRQNEDMKAWARLQIVLAREPSLVDGAALAALEHDLEEPHACVDQQRPARHVRHLEHLAGRDARLHEARGDVDHEAEACEPAAALEPAAHVAGQRAER